MKIEKNRGNTGEILNLFKRAQKFRHGEDDAGGVITIRFKDGIFHRTVEEVPAESERVIILKYSMAAMALAKRIEETLDLCDATPEDIFDWWEKVRNTELL